MSGNHPSELSPRQRMINMMYLVLTALLALNVSKEVLESFFEVNNGVVRTTDNFAEKNDEVYEEFIEAASQIEKAKPFKEKALQVRKVANELDVLIQEMKFDLVNKVDGEVYLGQYLDAEGDKIEANKVKKIPFSELSEDQRNKNIAYLNAKSNRDASGDLFVKRTNRATDLKNTIEEYKKLLLSFTEENEVLQSNIHSALATEDRRPKEKSIFSRGEGTIRWEEYNFEDMPAVGALTLLSKMQGDVRNTEADVIKFLRSKVDAGTIKFTSAEGVSIPAKSFILRGDTFRSEIFVSAKDETQDPEIFVGDFDTLADGSYAMSGDFDTIRVVNGRGIFKNKTTSEGIQKYKGLIIKKTAEGTKMYPFQGSYLVANKTAVVSPVNMNILYIQVDNPLKISVPGYSAGEVTPRIGNGTLSATKKSSGEWIARPNKKGKTKISLWADVEGRNTKMGEMEFRVKEVPEPTPYVKFSKKVQGITLIDKSTMVNAGGILADLKDFEFKGIRYMVTSFRMSAIYKGDQQKDKANGPQWTDKMVGLIKNTRSGNTITLYDIKAKRIDAKNTAERSLSDLVIEIK